MISKKLHLDGESMVSIFCRRGTIDETDAWFRAMSGKLVDELYPELTGHLAKIDVSKLAEDCKTIEELEKLQFAIFPEDMFTRLASIVDKDKSLNDIERLFTVTRVGDVLIKACHGHVNTILHQRADAIARTPKSRIIT